jgi:hypothetical protein
MSRLDGIAVRPHGSWAPMCQRASLVVLIGFLAALVPRESRGNDYKLGQNGWQLERLPDGFVLLRTEIFRDERAGKLGRQGLMIATCERGVRRVRFQIGDTPRSPSTRPNVRGRAIIRGMGGDNRRGPPPIYPRIHIFEDGSFELQETGLFGGNVRAFLDLLTSEPDYLEVVLFKGPETGAFTRGTALRFELENVSDSLVTIYGFQGLCFRSADQ